jgi:hypothetical protein
MFTVFAKADIAPNPDEARFSYPLIIETTDEVSDYRFFLNFSGDLREIEVKSNGTSEIPSMGGGARYSSGMIIAIPKKFLNDFPNKIESSYDDIGKRFSDLIREKKIGVIELGTHSFSRLIKKSESANYINAPYKLEKDIENGLKLTKLEIPKGKSGMDFSMYGVQKSLTTFGYIVLVSFPTAAIVILGIWLFRKKGRKLN